MLNDQFAYGNSSSMNTYSNLFAKSIFSFDWKNVHYELDEWLKINKIFVKNPNTIFQQGLSFSDKITELSKLKGMNKFFDELIEISAFNDNKFAWKVIDEKIKVKKNKQRRNLLT